MIDQATNESYWLATSRSLCSLAAMSGRDWSWIVKFDGQRQSVDRFSLVVYDESNENLVHRSEASDLHKGLAELIAAIPETDLLAPAMIDLSGMANALQRLNGAAEKGAVLVISCSRTLNPPFRVAMDWPANADMHFVDTSDDLTALLRLAAARLEGDV